MNKKNIFIIIFLFVFAAAHVMAKSSISAQRQEAIDCRLSLLSTVYDNLDRINGELNRLSTDLSAQMNEIHDEANSHREEVGAVNTTSASIKQLVSAVGSCENSDPSRNRYGIMNPGGERNGLAVLTETQARAKVEQIFRNYANAKPGISLIDAMHIYTPPSASNDTWRHARCISEKSGIALATPLNEIL